MYLNSLEIHLLAVNVFYKSLGPIGLSRGVSHDIFFANFGHLFRKIVFFENFLKVLRQIKLFYDFCALNTRMNQISKA